MSAPPVTAGKKESIVKRKRKTTQPAKTKVRDVMCCKMVINADDNYRGFLSSFRTDLDVCQRSIVITSESLTSSEVDRKNSQEKEFDEAISSKLSVQDLI